MTKVLQLVSDYEVYMFFFVLTFLILVLERTIQPANFSRRVEYFSVASSDIFPFFLKKIPLKFCLIFDYPWTTPAVVPLKILGQLLNTGSCCIFMGRKIIELCVER